MSWIREKFENYAQIVEIIGIISIIGSLIFVGLQLQQSQQISFAEQDLSSIEIELLLVTEINKHIDTWRKGNAGEPLDERATSIYKNLLDSAWTQANRLSQARARLGATGNIAMHEFALFLHDNPGAKALWLETTEQYITNQALLAYRSPGFDMRYNAVLVDLETLSPQSATTAAQ